MEAREQVVRDLQETNREVDRLRTEAEELGAHSVDFLYILTIIESFV